MARTKTIMLDIRRGGEMRVSGTVTTSDEFVPGRVAQINSDGAVENPTDTTITKGFVVEGKIANDSQQKVSIIIGKVVFNPFVDGDSSFSGKGSMASGVGTFTHGEAIYFKTDGGLTKVGASPVGTKIIGYYDAANSFVDGNIDSGSSNS